MSGEAFKRQTPSPPNVPEIVGSEKRENEIHRQSYQVRHNFSQARQGDSWQIVIK